MFLGCQHAGSRAPEIFEDSWITEDVLSLLVVCARGGGVVDPCTELPPSFDFAWRSDAAPERPNRVARATAF
jgi:hypothetical protein